MSIREKTMVSLSLALLSSSALAADWSSYRGDAQMSGLASGSLEDELKLVWTFETEAAIVSSPVVADGRVFIGSDDGNLYALDFSSGKKLWAFATTDMIEAPPLVVDGVVYVGSTDFFFYAVDAESGKLLWKAETDDKIVGGANVFADPELGETRIVVGSYDGALHCYGATSGEKFWSYVTDNYVNGTPAVIDGRAVFGGCDSALHVVDLRTGKALERVQLCAECHIAGSVAIAGDNVLFGHYGNAFVCVGLGSGETRWAFKDPRQAFFSSPAISGTRVVFGGRNKSLHCVDLETGELIWKKKTRRKIDGSSVICGDKVVFGSGDGRMYLLRLEDGEEIWTYEIGESIFSSPAVHAGHVFVGANDGVLYAFGPGAVEGGDSDG